MWGCTSFPYASRMINPQISFNSRAKTIKFLVNETGIFDEDGKVDYFEDDTRMLCRLTTLKVERRKLKIIGYMPIEKLKEAMSQVMVPDTPASSQAVCW